MPINKDSGKVRYIFSSKKLYLFARNILGGLFVVSGVLKLIDLGSFVKVIDAFAILPSEFSYLFALGLSVIEIGLGSGLIAGVKGSLLGIIVMLVLFIGVLSHAIYMGYDIDCGCFGPNDPEQKIFSGLKTALFRDIFFVAHAGYLYVWQKKNTNTIEEVN